MANEDVFPISWPYRQRLLRNAEILASPTSFAARAMGREAFGWGIGGTVRRLLAYVRRLENRLDWADKDRESARDYAGTCMHETLHLEERCTDLYLALSAATADLREAYTGGVQPNPLLYGHLMKVLHPAPDSTPIGPPPGWTRHGVDWLDADHRLVPVVVRKDFP